MALRQSIYDNDVEKKPVQASPSSDDELRSITGISAEEESAMDRGALKHAEEGGFYNSQDGGESGGAGEETEKTDTANERSFFNASNDKKRVNLKTLFKSRNRIVALVLVVSTLFTLIGALFMSLGAMNLSNFMANVERKGFMRFQVDMNGRSSKWLSAYMVLRFQEIENPSLAPKDRDNLIFRADRVDRNNPAFDWYRTLRASKFEQDLFEKHGIKFTSYAYQSGNSVRFRPALITINDKPIDFEINGSEIEALQNGDINGFNNRLIDYVEIKKFENDRAARAAISEVLKTEYPKWWHAYKRHHLRHDIQNMIGVRKWAFFENKRQAVRENVQDRRNAVVKKFVAQTLPEDSKSGKFIECLFGLSECKSSSDPSNPDSRAFTPTAPREGDRARLDNNGDGTADAPESDGSGSSNLNNGSESAAKAGESLRSSLPKLMKNMNIAAIIDALSRFDKALHDHSLSKFVVQAKGQYVAGVYTTLKIADDQFKTGEMNSEEFSAFMDQYGNMTNSEGWSTVVNNKPVGGTASAASSSYVPAANKKEFCSKEHQAEMEKPENRQKAEVEFQYLCPQDRVGGSNAAQDLENAWNSGPGAVLSPLLGVWRSTVGHIFNFLGDIIGAISAPVLAATGLDGTLEDIVGYVGAKAIQFAGANMDINQNTPSGRVGNLGMQGGAVLAEASSRQQGAAKTTPQTAREAAHRVYAYHAEERRSASFSERYLALSNPTSLAASQIPLMAQMKFSLGKNIDIAGLASIFSSPLKVFSIPVFADNHKEDGYAAANFAGIETFDLPKECINASPLKMTPQSATNADELGYIPANELTWDLVSDKIQWYDKLYEKVGGDEEKAMKVWNCGLIDNGVRGGIGGQYGYKGKNALDTTPVASSDSSGSGNIPSGSAQELAKKLVDSDKVKGDPRYMAQIQAIAKGDNSCNVNPTILKMLVGVTVQDNNSVYITSLNRRCTGVLTASGTGSYHYREGGGHAIDFGQFNGAVVGGNSTASKKLLESASKYLPEKTGYGQVESCGINFKIPAGSYPVPDECDHIHIQVPEMKAN